MTQTNECGYSPAEQHMLELHRLHRSVDLNARYYGARACASKRSNRIARLIGAVGSSTAIVGVFAGAPAVLLILSAATSLSTILAPLFLWEQKAIQFEKLHFAYCDLLQDFKSHLREIALAGELTTEHRAVSGLLFNRYGRLASQDDIKPDHSLIARFEADVKKAIPVSSLWMPPAA